MELPSLSSTLSNLNLFKGASSSVVGIDIGSSAIKVVQLKKKSGRVILETYGEIALGPYAGTEVGRATNLPVEKIEEALKDVMREANITTKDAAIAIPISSSLLSLVSMPALDDKKMAEMIPIEARRYIPLPLTEVSLDWWVIPKEEKEFTTPAGELPSGQAMPGDNPLGDDGTPPAAKVDVLLVAVLNEALEKYRRISKDLGLQNTFLEIEIFSTIRSVLDHGIAPVMVLDMGAASTKFYMVEHGVVKDSHILNRGSQDITIALSKALNVPMTKAEEIKRTMGLSADPSNKEAKETISLMLDYVFSEANRVLLSFEKRFHKTVSKIVLSGGGAVMKGFHESAKLQLQTESVLANPFNKTVAPPFLNQTLVTIGPDFAVALGLALQKLNQMG